MSTNSPLYDALVIGSGFGGAVSAYVLARAGLRTLLVERGGWANRDQLDWNPRAILLDKRYQSESPLLIKQYRDRRHRRVYPNKVLGGMSVFYGGASLRLREGDFARWPIGYPDLEMYYGQVEELLGVHGEAGQDPGEPFRSNGYPFPSIDLTGPAKRLHAAAVGLGYRPFKLPLAINFSDPARPRCLRCGTCDGFPCRIEAKNDLVSTLLTAAQGFGLEILVQTVVARLVAQGERIAEVECIDGPSGRRFSLRSRLVVLSAGALHSPAILLRSRVGPAQNGHLVGRNLMRHCNAVVAGVFPFATNPEKVFHKQLCLGDFYEDLRQPGGPATGVIQDIYTPDAEVLRHYAPRGVKLAAGLAAGHIQNLICIAEDEPQLDNGVALADDTDQYGLQIAQVTHRYNRGDCQRRNYLVRKAKKILRAAGAWLCKVYHVDTFSHAVGTVRFGSDPRTSVLDEYCRLRGLENLYVLDGSFMPSSGGVNPSLTIAANASRVAQHIAARHS
jgi:choline dehydrogenase-like flavoprotein